jgi:UPF0271 protein
MKIDLNSDLGESYGVYKVGMDGEILKHVSSVNIACGFHAGDPMVMDKTVEMAIANSVKIGAHPGLPDLMGFGRRIMNVSTEEVKNYMVYQIGALMAFVKIRGGTLNHVKPHGALYNMASKDKKLADAVVKAVNFKNEVFADRGYTDQGLLVPRSEPGAFVKGAKNCAERIATMVNKKEVLSVNNNPVKITADTVCVHGDNPESLNFVKALKIKLENLGFKIES